MWRVALQVFLETEELLKITKCRGEEVGTFLPLRVMIGRRSMLSVSALTNA